MNNRLRQFISDANAKAGKKKRLRQASAVPYEEAEQRALAQYLDLIFPGEWFHVPNGGMRSKAEGGKLKAQGVKSGVPDNFIVRPTKGAPGVIVELKRVKGGSLSKEQKEWVATLRGYGWIVGVCKGAGAAIEFIKEAYGGRG